MATTATLTKKKFDILKIYGDEMIISVDKNLWDRLYEEYLEDQEMVNNKEKLMKKYDKSIKS
jgi:hypothetical protein